MVREAPVCWMLPWAEVRVFSHALLVSRLGGRVFRFASSGASAGVMVEVVVPMEPASYLCAAVMFFGAAAPTAEATVLVLQDPLTVYLFLELAAVFFGNFWAVVPARDVAVSPFLSWGLLCWGCGPGCGCLVMRGHLLTSRRFSRRRRGGAFVRVVERVSFPIDLGDFLAFLSNFVPCEKMDGLLCCVIEVLFHLGIHAHNQVREGLVLVHLHFVAGDGNGGVPRCPSCGTLWRGNGFH